ncbi:MAG: hypothetical protein ABSH28_14655 [Acidobacteriota bacterium]
MPHGLLHEAFKSTSTGHSHTKSHRKGGRRHKFTVTPETRLIVAGLVPNRGDRLRKIDELIQPRLHQLRGLPDGISPKNVDVVFTPNTEATLSNLLSIVADSFSVTTA